MITPPLGPPGFVPLAVGSGFPPGPVTVRWTRGIGSWVVQADASGGFRLPVLVMYHDLLDRRSLSAQSGPASALADYLVVPPSAEPAGLDVATQLVGRR